MGDTVPQSDLSHFDMPIIQYNEEGWGPCELPDTFRDMPYQPFSKSDRLGKISDWTGTTTVDKKYPSMFLMCYLCFTFIQIYYLWLI